MPPQFLGFITLPKALRKMLKKQCCSRGRVKGTWPSLASDGGRFGGLHIDIPRLVPGTIWDPSKGELRANKPVKSPRVFSGKKYESNRLIMNQQ